MDSPYIASPTEKWLEITGRLANEHPLDMIFFRDLILEIWELLWESRIGGSQYGLSMAEIDPSAPVVSSFFEKLLTNRLSRLQPGIWRGGAGIEKDIHHVPDPALSIELKMSGQLGFKVFGNRSYAISNREDHGGTIRKERSGFYLIINFYGKRITLIRFGWIDGIDWVAQKAESGQMASLVPAVYEHKLVVLDGPYRLEGPVQLLDGVGAKAAQAINDIGCSTIKEFLSLAEVPVPLQSHHRNAIAQFWHFLTPN